MKMNRQIWFFMGAVLSSLLLGGGSAFSKSAELELYPFVKNLAIESDVEYAIGSFLLDSEMYDQIDDEFLDVRIVDDSGEEVPFLIRSKVQGQTTYSNIVANFTVREDGNHTIIEFTSQREVVAGIIIYASIENFSRSVILEGRYSDEYPFHEKMRGTYSYITTGTKHIDRRLLKPSSLMRCEEWRITIDNKDNPQLGIRGVTLVGNVYEGVFMNANPGSYRVFYGGGKSKKPCYDIGDIVASSGTKSVLYCLSEELKNEFFNKSVWNFRIGGRVVLTIAILIMVAVLGWGIVVASKQV